MLHIYPFYNSFFDFVCPMAFQIISNSMYLRTILKNKYAYISICQKGSHTADGFAVSVHTQLFSSQIHRVGMPFEQRTEKCFLLN